MTRTCIFNVKKKKNIERSKQESKMTSLREFKPLVLSELDLSYASRQKKKKKKKKKKRKECKIKGYMRVNRRCPSQKLTFSKDFGNRKS